MTFEEGSSSWLESSFIEDEVWGVKRKSDGNKVLGPDGFNMNFIKSNWSLITEDVMRVFDDLFLFSSFYKMINATFIFLIPKCSTPMSLYEYRLICLVGCIYKIVSKVLANRL